VRVSVLKHLLGDDHTVGPDRGVGLAVSYCIHPDICAFISMKRTSSAFLRSRGTRRLKRGDVLTPLGERAEVAFDNELRAKCLVHNLRHLVVLEGVHQDRVNFASTGHSSLYRMRTLWSNDVEIDEQAANDDDEESLSA
jgi:hypothetical protein